MDKEDIHHRMSKKVAQLTKVIFHLNTRNDEADQHVNAVMEAYEQEIEQVVRDANAKVSKAMEAVEKMRGDNASTQLAKVKEQYDAEKQDALKEIQNFRTKISDREQKNTKMWTEKVNKMNNELVELKSQCASQAEQFKQAVEDAERRKGAGIDELKDMHQAELERIKQEHQQRYEALQHEKEASERALRDSIAEEVAHREKLESEMKDATKRLSEKVSEKEAQLYKAEDECDRLKTEFQQMQSELQAEIEKLHKEISGSESLLKAKDEEIERLKREADSFGSSAEERYRNLQAEAASLQQKLTQTEAKVVRANEEKTTLEKRLAAEKSELEKKFAEERQAYEAKLQALQARIDKLSVDIENGEAAQRQLESELKDVCDENQEKASKIGSLETDLAYARDQLAKLSAEHASMSGDLDAALAESQAKVRQLERDLQGSKEELERQKADFERQLAELKGVSESELNALKKSHEDVRETMRKTHDAALQERDAQLSAQLKAKEEEWDGRLKAKEEQHQVCLKTKDDEIDELRRKASGDAQGLSERLQEKDAEISNLQSKLEALVAELEAQRQLKQEAEERVKVLQAELEQAMQDSKVMKEKHVNDMNQLKNDLHASHEKALQELISKHKGDIDVLTQDYTSNMARKDSEMEQLRSERITLESQYKKIIDDLEARIKQLIADAEAKGSQGRDEVEALRQKMQSLIDQERQDAVKRIQTLTDGHEQKISEVYAKQEEDIRTLRQKLGASHQEHVDDLRNRHDTEIAQLKSKFAKEISDKQEAHAAKLEDVNNKHCSAMVALKTEMEDAADKHREEVRVLEEKLQLKSDEVEQLRKRFQEAQAQIATITEQLKRSEVEHASALQQQEVDFVTEKRILIEEHKVDTEQLLETHLKETTEMNDQFERVKANLENQAAVLTERVRELQELYDSRPSREEDLERIMVLDAELKEKITEWKKMKEEMQFYKMELVNREQNYNKTFGSCPTVGKVDPLAKRNSMTSSSHNEGPKMHVVQKQQPGGVAGGLGIGNNVGPPLMPGTKEWADKKRLSKAQTSQALEDPGIDKKRLSKARTSEEPQWVPERRLSPQRPGNTSNASTQ